MSKKVKLLARYRTPEFLAYMARSMAQHAKENLQTSTNIDGSSMSTAKRRGKPLIATGAMLGSIRAVGNKCEVDTPYAAEVQRRTGNKFIGPPRPEVWAKWLSEYQEQTPSR